MNNSNAVHNDPADWAAASYRTDLAAEIDTIEDSLLEILSASGSKEETETGLRRLGVTVSPSAMRAVVGITAGILRRADAAGLIAELFGVRSSVVGVGDVTDFASRMMKLIDGDRNPSLQAKCVDYVYGLGLNGGANQTKIAAEEGVKRATVSRRCRNLVTREGRAPARGMKSEAAVEVYRKRQTGKVAKPARERWSFAEMFTGLFGAPEMAYAG